jgi:hypothetical protein
MDGNVYTSTFSSVSTTTADLFQILAPSNSRVEICEFEVTNLSTAPTGPVLLSLIRGSTTSGSGGSSAAAAVRAQPWGATAGSSVITNNTTLASTGAASEIVGNGALTVAQPSYKYSPCDGDGRRAQTEKIYLEASTRFALRASSTAAQALSASIKFREIGNQ